MDIKYKIRKIILRLGYRMLPKKYILLESKPDYSDNTYAVYSYIKKNGLLAKYKMVWMDKVFCNSKFYKLKYLYYKLSSKAIIFCNTMYSKASPNQVSFYLCHGSKSKNTRGTYEAPKDLDYILVQADVFKEAVVYGYNLSSNTKMVTLGYPRNDDLLLKNNIDKNKLFEKEFKKLIVWYPTFRQRMNVKDNFTDKSLPIIHNEKSARKINDYAKENNILIVIKPHFVQDVSYIKDNNLSNIIIIDDEFFKSKNIRSYQLLSLSDALLTDYSSVYYDYLLTDKPIGLVWEDYELYKKSKGFAMDPDMIYSGGEKIYDVNDFCEFLNRVSLGVDVLKNQRNRIKDLTNVYQDANSSKRVCEFIVDVLEK